MILPIAIILKITSILPKEFDAFSTAWDSVPQENKTLDNLCAKLQMESNKREANKVEAENSTQAAAFVAESDNLKPKPHAKRRLSCTGHIAQNCYTKPCKFCNRKNYKSHDCSRTHTMCSICKRNNHAEENYYSMGPKK